MGCMKDIQHTYKQHMNPFSRMDVHDGVMGLGMCCCCVGLAQYYRAAYASYTRSTSATPTYVWFAGTLRG